MVWRLIPPFCASGAWQMAVDAWLLDQCAQGHHPPVLRFYTWSPTAISLGHHQHRWPQHWPLLTWNNQPLDLVRRPTGGRAVLHQGDLTYAIVMSGLSGNRRQAYETICQFLIQGWKTLGLELHYGELNRDYLKYSNCFATATGADLTLPDGTKLIGSAQAWKGSTVLQHGSMRLNPDPTLWAQVFRNSASLGTIEAFQDAMPSQPTLIDQLVQSAQDCFQAEFKAQSLTEAERSAIAPYLTLVSEAG